MKKRISNFNNCYIKLQHIILKRFFTLPLYNVSKVDLFKLNQFIIKCKYVGVSRVKCKCKFVYPNAPNSNQIDGGIISPLHK